MEPETGTHSEARTAQEVADMRAEAATQLKAARELATRVRAEALHELEDARARVARIAAREEEMAERWAQLLEAENALALATKELPSTPVPTTLVDEATAEARQIIERAREEARKIREDAMHLLAVAEGEKAQSREIAQSETDRAASEAEQLKAEAAAEAQRLREEAARAAQTDDSSIYTKRGGRKLPRIGDSASSLLSEMSDLRARSAEEENRRVG